MKVLLNCPVPFSLAHGGQQVQIEQTLAGLVRLGLNVEPLRWWDENQPGDILHHFGRIPLSLLELARQKGLRIVMADLMGGLGARSPSRLRAQRLLIWAMRRTLPRLFLNTFAWEAYQRVDACVALTPWEGHLMSYMFGAPRERVHVVPNGVEDVFLDSPAGVRGPWLVCVATLNPCKRVVHLVQAAVEARTPVWVIGKPYAETDPCAQEFLRLAQAHPQFIRYEGAIEDRARLAEAYRQARGFVLLSSWESLSLSALEAAACECPLLLSDLPWARTVFQEKASYCAVTSSVSRTARALRAFYEAAPGLACPPKPWRWIQVAEQLKTVYERVHRL